jgi:hypothetical protein
MPEAEEVRPHLRHGGVVRLGELKVFAAKLLELGEGANKHGRVVQVCLCKQGAMTYS